MRHPRSPALVLASLLIGAFGSAEDFLAPKATLGSDEAKLDSALTSVVVTQGAVRESTLAAAKTRSITSAVAEAVATRIDAIVTDETLSAIKATGATVTEVAGRWNTITVEATPDQLSALSHIGAVRSLKLALKPHRHQQGLADNHADIDMNADLLRVAYGVDGAAIKIGVISDSINSTAAVGAGTVSGTVPDATLTGTAPELSGDLPTSIQVVRFLSGDTPHDTDEGSAMLEVIHDVAPGSPLAFGSCGPTQTTFATTISQLQAAGCKIIVDDIGFPDEPFFQDGPVAQAANTAHGAGCLYFSAAGNESDQGILTTYADINPGTSDPHTAGGTAHLPSTGADFHDWGLGGGTPSFLPITIPPGDDFEVVLEWNEPYASFGLGAGSRVDLDLFVYSSASVGSTILTSSRSAQGNASAPLGDPVEYLTYTNSGSSTQTVYLAVDRFAGTAASRIRLVFYTWRNVTCPAFGSTTIVGHPAATGAIAVGAIFYGDISNPAADGTDPSHTNAEYYSSKGGAFAGGMPYYTFDSSGNPSAPQLRNKPDLAAPDGVNVYKFSVASDTNGDSFPNFFGTSCAAPNAAAAAALVWASSPSLTNDQVLARFEARAHDIIATNPPSAIGFDDRTGWGLVDARAAVMPRPVDVGSTLANGAYIAGAVVPIQVTFGDPVTIDTTGGSPTLTLNTSPARTATYVNITGGNVLNFSYTIQAGDTSADLDVASASALALNGATISDGLGAVDLTLPVASAAGSLATNKNIVIDAVDPRLAVVGSPAASNTPSFTFTFTFSHDVTGFSLSSITLTHGTPGSLSGSGSVYTLPVTASAEGTVTADVVPGAATDANALASLAGSGSVDYDLTAPTVGITTATSVIVGHHATFAVVFSEPVTGLAAGDFTVTGGPAGTLGGSGASYTLDIVPTATGALSVTLATAGIQDLAGNPLAAAASASTSVVPPPSSGGSGCGIGGIGVVIAATLLALGRRRRS